MKQLSSISDALIAATEADIYADVTLGGRLLMGQSGVLSMSYAPFDHVEIGARLVLVGITPGAQQARNALVEARRKLIEGNDLASVLKAAKTFASFSGPMRTNLIKMLDMIGLNDWLEVSTTAEVWDRRHDLVHFTSALRYPVFVNGRNYSGSPSMISTPMLQ